MRKKSLLLLFVFGFVLCFGALYVTQEAKAQSPGQLSQYWGAWGSDWSTPIQVINPTGKTMIVAVIVYERDKLELGTPNYWSNGWIGNYVNCFYFELPPHGAAGIDDEITDINLQGYGFYAEVIAAAKSPLVRRTPEGIVMRHSSYGNPGAWPLGVAAFSVPNPAVLGCLQAAAAAAGNPNLWKNFGIF